MTEHSRHWGEPRLEPVVLHVAEARTAVVRGAGIDAGGLRGFFDTAFGALGAVLAREQLSPVGPAFSLYPRMPAATVDLEVGFAIDHPLVGRHTTESGLVVEQSRLPAGAVATVSHLGSYDGLGEAWQGLVDWAARTGHAAGLPFWEVYVTEPGPEADPDTMRTDLYLPVSG
ncbi:GyrI-like domain-containing protein [Zafaria sp. Z1313]|uniref:GyrI-like domain-containing protein n=1 Tax=Zafaria sp. Z1313 TaxID=3423202 RepID=UPI003D303187